MIGYYSSRYFRYWLKNTHQLPYVFVNHCKFSALEDSSVQINSDQIFCITFDFTRFTFDFVFFNFDFIHSKKFQREIAFVCCECKLMECKPKNELNADSRTHASPNANVHTHTHGVCDLSTHTPILVCVYVIMQWAFNVGLVRARVYVC